MAYFVSKKKKELIYSIMKALVPTLCLICTKLDYFVSAHSYCNSQCPVRHKQNHYQILIKMYTTVFPDKHLTTQIKRIGPMFTNAN